MSESVVADFIGRFHTADVGRGDPVRGRVVLSQKRLVLVANDARTTIPLASVFDVAVGIVPPEHEEFFSDTVTVAYRTDDAQRTAVVEGDGDDVERFKTVLFKTLLNGRTATVIPRARAGGRTTNADPKTARLRLGSRRLRFVGDGGGFDLDLAAVVHVERETRSFDGDGRPALSVRHLDGGEATTSHVALPSSREMNVLGRFIRLEYGSLREEVVERDYTEEEMEVLVALYSAPAGVSLPAVLGTDPAQVTMVLNGLAEDGLVSDDSPETSLTPKGRIAASAHLERVNA